MGGFCVFGRFGSEELEEEGKPLWGLDEDRDIEMKNTYKVYLP